MSPKSVFRAFEILFPSLVGECEGFNKMLGCSNSIRIRRVDGHDWIFTYNAHNSWCLEDARTFRKK